MQKLRRTKNNLQGGEKQGDILAAGSSLKEHGGIHEKKANSQALKVKFRGSCALFHIDYPTYSVCLGEVPPLRKAFKSFTEPGMSKDLN